VTLLALRRQTRLRGSRKLHHMLCNKQIQTAQSEALDCVSLRAYMSVHIILHHLSTHHSIPSPHAQWKFMRTGRELLDTLVIR
jgi:hypothetical protein